MFVQPTDPDGGGFYLQAEPVDFDVVDNARWSAPEVYLGSVEDPVSDGAVLNVVAVIAGEGFDVRGSVNSAPVSSIESLAGVIAVREPLTLTVIR